MIPQKLYRLVNILNLWSGIIKTITGVLLTTFEGDQSKMIGTHSDKVDDTTK